MAIVTARSRRAVLGAALASLIATVALTVPAAAGAPTTRYVDDDDPGCGPSPYASVQAAIDDSNPGDTILVCPGEYGSGFFVDVPDLTIRGVDPWTATFVPPVGLDTLSFITVAGVSGTLIKWLEIEAPMNGDCSQVFALIDIQGAPDTSIRANHLQPLGTPTLGDCAYDAGVLVSDSDGVVIAWNRIIDFRSRGIRVGESDDADIHGNSARFLHAGEPPTENDAIGIQVFASLSVRIANNVVRSLSTAGVSTPALDRGMDVQTSGEPEVIGNRVSYADTGMLVTSVSEGVVRENRIRRSGTGPGLFATDTVFTRFVRNLVKGGAGQGIVLTFETGANVVRANDARGNAGDDCVDGSAGNTWTGNLGAEVYPFCGPPPP